MTDKDFEELEQIDPNERARLLEHKNCFTLGNEHMAMIVNDLLADDDAKLGRIMRDLVTLMTTGENALLDNIDKSDRIDKTARKLLYDDCRHFTDRWLLTSYHSSKHRKKHSETEENTADDDQSDQGDASVDGFPPIDTVLSYAVFKWGGSMKHDEIERATKRWYDKMTKNHWHDDLNEPVKEWRKVLDTYLNGVWSKR